MDKSTQLGFIAKLAKEIGPKNKLGRKAFQKIVHLASALGGIPTGYSFSFYIYGPFSRELSADLELAESSRIISSAQDQTSGSYEIKAGQFADGAEKNASEYLAKHKLNLDKLLSAFGEKPAKALELYSTIVFIESAEADQGGGVEAVVGRVKSLKPKYGEPEIRSAISYVGDFRKKMN